MIEHGKIFRSRVMDLEPSWIDYNGHLNMAFYNVLFDRCVDEAFEIIGLGPNYIKERNNSFFTAETHVCYLRELSPDDKVIASFQILAIDSKRVHFFQELSHANEEWVSATSEQMLLHMDMDARKVASFPEDIMENIIKFSEAHKKLPWPEKAGRKIGFPQK